VNVVYGGNWKNARLTSTDRGALFSDSRRPWIRQSVHHQAQTGKLARPGLSESTEGQSRLRIVSELSGVRPSYSNCESELAKLTKLRLRRVFCWLWVNGGAPPARSRVLTATHTNADEHDLFRVIALRAPIFGRRRIAPGSCGLFPVLAQTRLGGSS
jgi:hypothetical protein